MEDYNAIFSHFSNIIDNMLDKSAFFRRYFQSPSFLSSMIGHDGDEALPKGINIYSGITRGCIVDENYPNWVVKFTLSELDSQSCGDECDIEIARYEQAEEEGLEYFFTRPEYLGAYERNIITYPYEAIDRIFDWYDYCPADFEEQIRKNEEALGKKKLITIHINLYAYPYAKQHQFLPFSDEETYICQNIVDSSPSVDIVSNVAFALIHEYGEEEYQQLLDFILRTGINDIHDGNVGDINGKIVIFDYSGA